MVKNIFNKVDNFTANSFPGQGEKNFNTIYSSSKGNYRKVLVWENTTRKKLHPLELTSKVL